MNRLSAHGRSAAATRHWPLNRVGACRRLLGAAATAGLVALSGCASDEQQAASDVNDPLEPFNRYMLALNEGVDTVVLRPVAVAFRDLVPYPIQDAVHNFLNNLTEPVTLVNQLLQGQVDEAGHTFGRFLTNSTLGLGGAFVIVDIEDVPGEREDFGQTLATWGVDTGPYLVLPIIGPTNTRDSVGRIVDFFTDPFNIWAVATGTDGVQLVRSGLVLVDTKVRTLDAIDGLREDSLDFYARLRSAYQQRRQAEIENSLSTGSPFDTDAFDDEGLDDEDLDDQGPDDEDVGEDGGEGAGETVVENEDAE